jgi:error-prone DNA polymerase
VSRPVAERLVLAGAFDRIYGITGGGLAARGKVTRRDLLLQVADLDRYARATHRGAHRASRRDRARLEGAAARNSSDPWHRARAQSQAPLLPDPVSSVQLTLDLGDAPADALHTGEVSGLPELDREERVRAELEILGLDASGHVLDSYAELLDAIGVTRSAALLQQRSRAELLVAGVKVATQTPPIRSGRRVVFLTLDDATGPVDATFFEDALAPCASTVFGSWLLLVRGRLRRTGRRGVSLRATGCWELGAVHDAWREGGVPAVRDLMSATGPDPGEESAEQGVRRVLVHATGFRLSPYADVRPAGESVAGPPRRLWHSSPGSPGG